MSLFRPYPSQLAPDRSLHTGLTFVSPADGREQRVDVYSPPAAADQPLPLVIGLHGAGWTASQDYHWGLPDLKVGYHRGWYGLAAAYGVIIASPHGHHRREETMAFASPEQIADIAHLARYLPECGIEVDEARVYACGLSMGGQEALVAAGCHPDIFAAVVAFNPAVDLAVLQQDMQEVDRIRGTDAASRIVSEVGGLPNEVPAAYAERSPLQYIDGLARVPTMIFWSDRDFIVPRQVTHHSYRLYQLVKGLSVTSPICEYNHTYSHGVTTFPPDVCWQLHEWSDYELALRWLLIHRRCPTGASFGSLG
jgi:dipeptidyl aminopeptidase/acylaminoacyl peptidase